jgi:tetratricopeptide (TPR) repeat protein
VGEPKDPGRATLDGLARAFEIEMAEAWDRLHPDDVDNLRWLAYAYTEERRYDDALAADLRRVAAAPARPEPQYDLACSYALLGRRDDAFESLERAIALGFRDADLLESDDDLESLHDDPRWSPLRARLRA